MAVKKKGSKWYPVGKSGKMWKTGYPTEAKAKKALTQANRYFSSMKSKGKSKKKKSSSKSSKKKTTKKKKTSPKKKKATGGGRTTKKKSLLTYLRAGIYVTTIAAPLVAAVQRHGFTMNALGEASRRYSAVDTDGRFSQRQLGQTYAPMAIWAAIDLTASKAGVYRRVGAVLS